ncbi:MAG: HTTM domain-containing protein [Archangium sp.]
MIERARAWLNTPRDAAALAVFRIVLGLLVSVSAARFLAYGWVEQLFDTKFQFHYFGFGWVPWPGLEGVRALFVALVVLGLMVAAGAAYRVASVLTFVAFAWLQLLDVSNYLNHYYLVSLLLLLASFMPLHRLWSVDAWLRPSLRSDVLPAWCSALLKFQVGVVYFFAGLAKLNGDWLVHGAPLHLWLSARTSTPFIGPWLSAPEAALFMSWAGFLFDTSVPFFLLWKRARPFAFAVVIVFHAMTRVLFPIGMFPFIMTLSALVFFDASWPRLWLRRFRTTATAPAPHPDPLPALQGVGRLSFFALGAYVVLQLVLPLRAHFYGGDVSWHEQGMRFSWRVMTREKNGSVTYIVKNRVGREWHVSPSQYLTRVQERELAVQPDLILQLGQHIGRDFDARGEGPVEVRADTLASLNGRMATPLVDPHVDLMTVNDSLAKEAWVAAPTEGPPLSALRRALARY